MYIAGILIDAEVAVLDAVANGEARHHVSQHMDGDVDQTESCKFPLKSFDL